jgi:hypothetical protein
MAAQVKARLTEFRQHASTFHDNAAVPGEQCQGDCGWNEFINYVAVIGEEIVEAYMECLYAPAPVKPGKKEALEKAVQLFAAVWGSDEDPGGA